MVRFVIYSQAKPSDAHGAIGGAFTNAKVSSGRPVIAIRYVAEYWTAEKCLPTSTPLRRLNC